MGRKILSVALAAILAGGTLGVSLAQSVAPAPANTFKVEETRGASTVSLGGTVIPHKEVTFTAQLPGRIKFLAGEEGDAFEKGTLLAAIDDRELRAKRQAAVSQLANADSALRSAGMQYSRELWAPQSRQAPGGMGLPNMFDDMFSRPMQAMTGQRNSYVERHADVYTAGTRIEQARNAIVSAQSEIQAIDSKLRDARSIAPFDGVIMKKYVEEGDVVQPGQPLVDFADLRFLQIQVDVPARLMPGVSDSMIVQAHLDVGGAVVPVRVAQIFPMADAQRHTVTVKFDIPEGTSAAPGMYVNVNVPDVSAPSRSLPYIPVVAVRYLGSLPGVYVLNEQGQPELRLIRLGERLDDNYTTVLSGLNAGEVILTNPSTAGGTHWGPAGGTPGGGPTSGAR